MWTHKYEFKLIESAVMDEGISQLKSDTRDYDMLCKAIVEASRLGLAQMLNKLLKTAPTKDYQAEPFYFVTDDGFYTINQYYISAVQQVILFSTVIVSENEFALYQQKHPPTKWYKLDDNTPSDIPGNMPPTLPPSKPKKADEEDEEDEE